MSRRLRFSLPMILLGAIPALAQAIPVEDRAVFPAAKDRDIAIAAARLVRAEGYRCDSISGGRPFFTSYGFRLTCNEFRYTYDLEDKGRGWTISTP